MTDKEQVAEKLQKSRDIISQLREIRHYSQGNLEKLSEFWLALDDEADFRAQADAINGLLTLQGDFQEKIDALINDFEIECNRIENEET